MTCLKRKREKIKAVKASPLSMDSTSPAKIMTGEADVDLPLLSKATKDRVLKIQLVPSIFIMKKYE